MSWLKETKKEINIAYMSLPVEFYCCFETNCYYIPKVCLELKIFLDFSFQNSRYRHASPFLVATLLLMKKIEAVINVLRYSHDSLMVLFHIP